jgi:hypothetical protein
VTGLRIALRRPLLAAALALALFPGCLTYEKSQTKVSFDPRTGVAHVQTTYWNVASTEPGRREQWDDFEQLDSLRRSDAYFATSYLRSPAGGQVGKRRVWIEKGQVHASASVATRDLNELAEGWSADSSGYRFTSNLEITATNGQRTDDEKPTVFWPRSARLLSVAERDPHFGEAVPFRPEIRDSLAKRLPPVVKATHEKRAVKHRTVRRARAGSKRSRSH